MASTQDEIIEIIAKQMSLEPDQVTPESTMESLSIESLDLVEIIFAIEEKFDIAVPYNANDPSATGTDMDTVGDVIEAVGKLVEEKA